MSDEKYVPFYHNGEYIGELPKSYADYLNRIAAKKANEVNGAGDEDDKVEPPLTKQEFEAFKIRWTMTTALLRRDWTIIEEFVETDRAVVIDKTKR